jgi:hypothetical protein
MAGDCRKFESEKLVTKTGGNNSCTRKKNLNLPEKPSKSSQERVGSVDVLLNQIKFITIDV